MRAVLAVRACRAGLIFQVTCPKGVWLVQRSAVGSVHVFGAEYGALVLHHLLGEVSASMFGGPGPCGWRCWFRCLPGRASFQFLLPLFRGVFMRQSCTPRWNPLAVVFVVVLIEAAMVACIFY